MSAGAGTHDGDRCDGAAGFGAPALATIGCTLQAIDDIWNTVQAAGPSGWRRDT